MQLRAQDPDGVALKYQLITLPSTLINKYSLDGKTGSINLVSTSIFPNHVPFPD